MQANSSRIGFAEFAIVATVNVATSTAPSHTPATHTRHTHSTHTHMSLGQNGDPAYTQTQAHLHCVGPTQKYFCCDLAKVSLHIASHRLALDRIGSHRIAMVQWPQCSHWVRSLRWLRSFRWLQLHIALPATLCHVITNQLGTLIKYSDNSSIVSPNILSFHILFLVGASILS